MLFNVCRSVHHNNILIYVQQDATLHSLFYLETALHFILSGNCSACFGWYHHPSSGAYTTVSTASGICHAVIAIICHPQHTQTGSNSSTIAADSNNGVTNTRCCRNSCLRSWWWVEVPPETCRAVSIQNKLCNIASCRTYIIICVMLLRDIIAVCLEYHMKHINTFCGFLNLKACSLYSNYNVLSG